jgi:hypothetical protein
MSSKLRDSIIASLIIAAISALVSMYADIQVLKAQSRYYHGDPIKP